MSPTSTSTAPTMPVPAAKIAHIVIVASASPPRKRPSQTRIASKSFSAMPERSSIEPMKTKSGIATRM